LRARRAGEPRAPSPMAVTDLELRPPSAPSVAYQRAASPPPMRPPRASSSSSRRHLLPGGRDLLLQAAASSSSSSSSDSMCPSLLPCAGVRARRRVGEGMQRRERTHGCTSSPGHRKMQQLLRHPLEPLQYAVVLHFADAVLDAATAGVGLRGWRHHLSSSSCPSPANPPINQLLYPANHPSHVHGLSLLLP
jgi:hypothetical protein